METTERLCPAGNRVPVFLDTDGGNGDERYEGILWDGADKEKLIHLVDQILFDCKLARYKTRLLAVCESEGCVMLWWSRYAPAVSRNSRMLELVAGGELIDHLSVQESVAVRYAA